MLSAGGRGSSVVTLAKLRERDRQGIGKYTKEKKLEKRGV